MRKRKTWQSIIFLCLISLVFIPPTVAFQNFSINGITSSWRNSNLQIQNNQLILSPKLQAQLMPEITKAQQELNELSKQLNINFNEEIGIVYLHQGRDYWSVKFTYSGLVLEGYDEIILPIRQIFALKKTFENTPSLTIQNTTFHTTGSMRQIGPILHQKV